MKRFAILVFLLVYLFCFNPLVVHCGELNLSETDDTISITQRGKAVLEYVKTARTVPEGVGQHYSRSGYIHPVYTPTGQELTGDYPADHAHQHALFFAWTKSSYAGHNVDFWNQAKNLGKIEFREVVALQRMPREVSFTVKHAFMVQVEQKWVDVLHEVWTVTVYETPDDYFLFDVTSVQQCVSDKPLELAEYHYGGMAFRGNYKWLKEPADHSILPGDLQYLTSDGKNRWEGNHTRPDWVAFSGRIDGLDVSAAIFCNPRNFRAPQHVRIHPHKPYFCFAPMVAGGFQIAPGDPYVSSYRYLVTSNKIDSELISEHWQRFAEENE
ncbi:PmoA family protein [Planctomycetaceae bacterium SH139]